MPNAPEAARAEIRALDLAAEWAELGEELERAALRVLASGRYVLGPEVEAFEREFARFQRVEHAVGVASGTDALVLALRALGVERGDRVLTSPFTFFASAASIDWIGARVVLCDVEPDTALIDPKRVEDTLEGVACILPVHLYGALADMQRLRALADLAGASLVEDAAQAHGAERDGVRAGELGDAAAFSFYPTKNLGAAGEAGAVLTRREDLALRLRRLRDHGSSAKYQHAEVGTNSRLHALQAALLSVKLPRLEQWNERRRQLAALYDAAFAGSESVRPLARPPRSRCAYHQYTVRLVDRDRDRVAAGLAARGIHAAVHYPLPVHLQPAASGWGYGPGSLPVAEGLAREVLCLPVHPYLGASDVERVADALLDLAR